MKKLSKLKLNDARIMNDREMKTVIGGYGFGTHGYPYPLPEIVIYGIARNKSAACVGSADGARCCWAPDGISVSWGKCISTLGPLHCSDLN